ncbi:tetratricopeptide repeat protein, partial [Actinomadura sp. HBU206391]|nr:tetratricopeptide repeat protein [Actinomadura sp. HBU206391]
MRKSPIARLGFLAAVAAVLAAAPAVLVAAVVKDWRWLTAAAVAAPIAMVFAGVLQERFKRNIQARDDLAKEVAKGVLVPGGRLPRVREVVDPIAVGVHPAPLQEPAAGDDGQLTVRGVGGDRVPVYVPRDVDVELRRVLGRGGFVLLAGDSTAGKTRAAFEAMRAVLPDHILIVPESRDGVAAAVAKAATVRRCVLWLNDLELYLGPGGLTRKYVIELVGEGDHHRVVLATLRAVEEERLTTSGEEGRQLQRDNQAVLDQAHRIFVDRQFSPAEQNRAAELADEDPRIGDALAHAG